MEKIKITETNFNELLENYSELLKKFNPPNSGPSIYFHKRALEERRKEFLSNSHIEMIYAVLASWGMHRMGATTKTKMKSYDVFKARIISQENKLRKLKDTKLENLSKDQAPGIIEELTEICFSLEVSESNSQIVGNSKTLAHILPDLVPPIDRQYTLLFFQVENNSFYRQGKLKQPVLNKKDEKNYFIHILNKAFEFTKKVENDRQLAHDELRQGLNTSYPKIFDNLIMSYIINKKQQS